MISLGGCPCHNWKPSFFLALYLTGVHFRAKLHQVGDVSEPKIKCLPIRTQEIDGARL